MNLNAILDIDLVAVESQDQVSVLLELTAPEATSTKKHAPTTLEVVLDRSGSMGDGRLEAAKAALNALISRLDPRDNFGLVLFDEDVVAAIPAGPLRDKDYVRQLIRSVYAGSTTNLSGGYMRGIQEVRRVQGDEFATVLLISDGLANVGVTSADQLEEAAQRAHFNKMTTSTIGVGLGYDETLMTAMARGGAGNAHFAEEADAAGAAIAAEVDHLLDQVLQAASLTVHPTEAVEGIQLFNDLPVVGLEHGFVVELGDFYSGETRKLLMQVAVPAIPDLGLTQIAELELRYVEVGSLEAQTVTLPLHVNVVPGDTAAERVPNPTVRSELAFQQAQRAKQEAADELRRGNRTNASHSYDQAAFRLGDAVTSAPPELANELSEEAELLRDLASRARFDDERRLSKFTEMDRHLKERKRGRRRPRPD